MAEHPIIFSTEMVRAILDGRKTQTRRIIKPQPYKSDRNPPNYSDTAVGDLFICPDYFPTEEKGGCVIVECEALGTYHCMGVKAFVDKHCPYGKVGDRLYVKEGYQITANLLPRDMIKVFYIADESINRIRLTEKEWNLWSGRKYPYRKTPGRFMYKSLARIFLEITNISVERVQDISESDIIYEGCPEFTSLTGIDELYAARIWWWNELWDLINAKRGYGWDKNPWCWCITFKRIEK